MAPGPASQQSEEKPKSKDITAEATHFTQSTSFLILTNAFFLLVASSNFIGHLGMFVPYTYIPDAASLKDIPTDQSNYLLSIMGNNVTMLSTLEEIIARLSSILVFLLLGRLAIFFQVTFAF